ncbi:hypothetical protein [Enterococcus raffinosus]|uniref:hypothetical protein n=1 Tax=Enterococcus raffinosus TaxID=71452 RepID=UPI001C967336|nr:hypothetical protein [Enterococcus raffinosus]QZO07900.1 hypothetical protein K5P74_08350 [Enterococcus raffinosus]
MKCFSQLTEETAQVLGYKEKREEVYDVRSIYQVTFKKDDSELTWVKAVVATSEEDAKEVFEEENQFEEIKSVRLLGTVVDELMDDGIGFENE